LQRTQKDTPSDQGFSIDDSGKEAKAVDIKSIFGALDE
jgi:hypothetical protein